MSYRTKNLKIFILALLVAIVAGVVVRMFLLGKVDKEEQIARDVTTVLVAKSDLAVGEKIEKRLFKWVKWPRQSVQNDYITQQEDLDKIEGAIVRDAIISGEPVKRNAVVHVGEQGVLAAVIAPGKRAFTILLKRTTNITPLISPGDFVDVIVASRGKDRKSYEGKTVIERVRVLEIDGKFEKTKTGNTKPPRSVTIEVDEDDAESLAAALEAGDPTISLHSFSEDPSDRRRRLAKIQRKLPEPVAAAPGEQEPVEISKSDKPKEHMVTILRGDKKEEVTFKN